ncbi:ATPase, T2SS/T4P/T4SS family [Paracoccus litorisediminis]|uniref:ATPase, T2SS/T4P/T4SS family n=1 Tax=Paracoccus litorisediminis TaxID=2006130 RepID=UPI003730EDF9
MFTDMYLPADPMSPIMVRGLRSAENFISAYSKGLTRLPDMLVQDALKLQDTIQRKWKHSDYSREFTVTYESHAYRCSLIAPPNFDWEDEDAQSRDTDRKVEWCVRQISAKIPSFDDIRLPSWARQDIDRLTDLRGLVLIAGPFASGKTTLAASAFNYWVSKSKDVGIALEDPPEIPMERTSEEYGKIIQIDLLDKSIRMAIKNSRRWSPRYVFLGEVRTADVSAELMHMSISGPLTVCTIHASDPVQAIVSLFRFTSEVMSEDMARAMIASSLQQVFHQEIVNGRATLKTARVHGTDTHLIKAKIASGNFKGLYEDFERQAINRANPQA